MFDLLHQVQEIFGRVPKVNEFLELFHSEIFHLFEFGVKIPIETFFSCFKDSSQLFNWKWLIFLFVNSLALSEFLQYVESLMMWDAFWGLCLW